MSYLFHESNGPLLAQLADPATLLAFDFDGTLAPLTPDRHAAYMTAGTAVRFAELCRLRRCAVISGRGRDDVARRLSGAVPLAIIGNHGAEHGNKASDATIALMQDIIATVLATLPRGAVDIEDKTFSVSLHLPDATAVASTDRVRRIVQGVLEQFAGRIRVVPGHNVVNVTPVAASTKGDALRRLITQYAPARALFVGDDVTDEDAFRLRDPRLTSVRIGFAPDSAAPYFLAAQDEIDRLLSALLAGATPDITSREDHIDDNPGHPPDDAPTRATGAP